jgi:hypothetical protein
MVEWVGFFAALIPLTLNLNGKFPLTPTPLPKERGTSRGKGCVMFMGAMREKTRRWILTLALERETGRQPFRTTHGHERLASGIRFR